MKTKSYGHPPSPFVHNVARPSKAQAMARFDKALGTIPEIKPLRYKSPGFIKWRRDTEVAIANTFGSRDRNYYDA